MRWHTFRIIVRFALLASVALLSALEVVVLALGALPSSVGELEVTSSGGWGELVDGVLGSVSGAARAGGVVLEAGDKHWLSLLHHLSNLWDNLLLLNKLLHVWEELLMLSWCLLWISIIVIDDNVVCYCLGWWSPYWVLGEDGSELLWLRLWLQLGRLDVLDQRIEGASTLVKRVL